MSPDPIDALDEPSTFDRAFDALHGAIVTADDPDEDREATLLDPRPCASGTLGFDRPAVAAETTAATSVGHVVMRGHGAVATTEIAVSEADGRFALDLVIGGSRPRHGRRSLDCRAFTELFDRLEAAVAGPPGGGLRRGRVGEIELALVLDGRRLVAALDGRAVARLSGCADEILREVALAGLGIAPELHPVDATDRSVLAAIDGDEGDDTTVG